MARTIMQITTHASRHDAVAAHAACRDAAAVRAHRLFAALAPLNPPRRCRIDSTEGRKPMTYQNYSLKQLQAIDAAHHLHPFTDHRELRADRLAHDRRAPRGRSSTTARATSCSTAWPGSGASISATAATNWPSAAYEQMKELPYYNSFFKMRDADAGAACPEARRNRAEGHQPGVLRLVRLGSQRHGAAARAPLLGARRQAGEEPHHLAQDGLSRLDDRRHVARRHGAACTTSSAARCPTSSM